MLPKNKKEKRNFIKTKISESPSSASTVRDWSKEVYKELMEYILELESRIEKLERRR